jgi:hydrogenase nickel incorporation protein HypB
MEVKVVKKVLGANDSMAQRNREMFAEKGVTVVNLMSSPGSGKTTLLERTLERIMPEIRSAVIVGDVCTTHDADRLAKSGAPVVQICTDDFGGECHLGAHVVAKAAEDVDLNNLDLLIVENVGNLVCPAEFDIGENARAVVLSVTEGEDKPAKYPAMFRACDATVLSKTDLLPRLDFDLGQALAYIDQVHPDMPVFSLSSRTGEGMDAWIDWLKGLVGPK